MIDTLGIGYDGQAVGAAELAAFRGACRGNIAMSSIIGETEDAGRVVSWNGCIPGLGRLTLNVDGYVRHEGSLVKSGQRLDGTPEDELRNIDLLSADDCDRTLYRLTERLESVLPFIQPETLKCYRVDVAYQRRVASSMRTISALKGAIRPTAGGCAWFDNKAGVPTGIKLMGKSVVHRAYDKGLESLHRGYENVLRSEEQLRTQSVGLGKVVNMANRCFDREAAREILNERYLDVAYEGCLDVSELVAQSLDTQALLILHPELMPAYRARVKRSSYYEMSKKVREARATAVPDDLRIPEDAWK